MKKDLLHFWLTVGHVLYLENKTGNVFATRNYNSVLKSPNKMVSLMDVSLVQRSLFMKSVDDYDQTLVTTKEIVVMGMMYLGQFTEEEFTKGAISPSQPVMDTPKFQ